MPSAFEHGPALTVPASNTTAKAAVIWSAASNLGESTIILDSGGNGRIGIAGDLDTITITSGTVTVAGTVAATTLTGAGSGITALNATQLTSGTMPDARFPATLPFISVANLTYLPASGATFSGSTNNTVVIVIGVDAMVGEANLTFTGSLLSMNGAMALGPDLPTPAGNAKLNMGDADNSTWQFKPVNTQSVGTSATTINTDTAGGWGTGFALIFGTPSGGGSGRWFDLVIASSASDTCHVVQTQNLDGSPPGRTYSYSGNNFRLAMASGTHDVNVLWLMSGNPG